MPHELRNPTAKRFFDEAEKVMAANRQAATKQGAKDFLHPTINQKSPQWQTWMDYFHRHLGWVPVQMQRAARDENLAFTVPALWPQWFDPSFVPQGVKQIERRSA